MFNIKSFTTLSSLLLLFFIRSSVFAAAAATKEEDVVVLGLGVMGRPVAECFAQKGHTVHAWNRGLPGRQLMRDRNVQNVNVYDSLEETINKGGNTTIFITVLGDPELKSATEVINSVPNKELWAGKTVVQFSSHEPFSIKDQEKLLKSYGAVLIGGAMLSTPEDVCSNNGSYLISASEDGEDQLNANKPIVEHLGPVVSFTGDVGLASLTDIFICHSLWFGVAGVEVSFLALELYHQTTDEYKNIAVDLVSQVVTAYTPHFVNQVSAAIRSGSYDEQAKNGSPARMITAAVEMHNNFFRKMGFRTDLHSNAYEKHMKKVPGNHGSSEVVKYYPKPEEFPTADFE